MGAAPSPTTWPLLSVAGTSKSTQNDCGGVVILMVAGPPGLKANAIDPADFVSSIGSIALPLFKCDGAIIENSFGSPSHIASAPIAAKRLGPSVTATFVRSIVDGPLATLTLTRRNARPGGGISACRL